MKRKLSLVLLALLLLTTLVVSCNVETNAPESGTVTLRFRTDDETRALTSSRTSLDTNQYNWYYEAKKSDASNGTSSPASGTTTTKTKVGTDGKLTNKVGPFSLGKWDFTLYAYSTDSSANDVNLVYKGTASSYNLTEDTETIDITVEPQKTSGGKGILQVEEGINFVANGTTYKATTVTVSDVDGTNSKTQPSATNGYYSYSDIASGSYKVTVAYIDNDITYATNTIYINVWNCLTTTVSGTLDEITIKATFAASENADTGAITQTTSVTSGSKVTYEFDCSPASNSEQSSTNKTTIEGTFTDSGTGGTLTVDVYDILAASSAEDATFTVTSDNNAVAAVTITTSDSVSISQSDNLVKVSTTISKGLTSVAMYHSNSQMDTNSKDTADAVTANGNWYYNAETGALVFVTSSFSSFHVTSDVNVYDADNNIAYKLTEDTDNNYIFKDKDNSIVTPNGSNLVLLDCSLSNDIPDDCVSKSWTVVHKNCSKVTDCYHEENASDFSGGYGTKIEPYIIATKDQFQNITAKYDKYAYYKVKDGVAEIDCSDWTPVKLYGSFDGNNVNLKNINQKLFSQVGYLPSAKELANWDTRAVTLKDFTATFDLEGDLDAGVAAVGQINGNNTTTFDSVTIAGKLSGGSNSAAFFNYTGPNTFGSVVDGMKQTISFKDCSVTAVLTCTSGNVGILAGHPGYSNPNVTITCDKALDSIFTGSALITSSATVRIVGLDSKNEKYTGVNSETWQTTLDSNSNKISRLTIVNPSKNEGYSVDWTDGATRMEVYIAAQLTAVDSDGNDTAAKGITLTLSHVLSNQKKGNSETSKKILDAFTSCSLESKQATYSASVLNSKLTCTTGGTENYSYGTIKLQVAQYDSNGKMVAFGNLEIATKDKNAESWTVN